MPHTSEPLTKIILRGSHLRQTVKRILNFHKKKAAPPSPSCLEAHPIRVVCISDTHNKRPEIPLGDLLIHAGDLTENGSFEEVQAELSWLSSQPHRYKILIAGNHDVLLDTEFLEKHPRRRYGQTQTSEDLDFGSVIYLEDSTVTLTFPTDTETHQQTHDTTRKFEPRSRNLTIFGSPWTPQYGVSAFQYPPGEPPDWESAMERTPDPKPDIMVTHGPAQFHLDTQSFRSAGCPYLAEEVARVRPRLVVFGHIHVGYGREDVVLDRVQRAYEEVMAGWAGWEMVIWMAVLAAWARMRWFLRGGQARAEKLTAFVNAAVVGGPANELQNTPIVVEL